MSYRSTMRSALAALAIMTAVSQAASAYTTLPPNSTVAGKSIAEWTSAWWTWALQAPAASNPLTDPTGAFANVNNNGPVFFVAGTMGTGGPITRSFDVPAGKPLLVPIFNFFDTEPAEIDPPTATLADRVNAVNAVVAGWPNAVVAGSLFASIDGNTVSDPAQYLEVTGLFSMGATEAGSLIQSLGVPTGAELFPSKAIGYWLMIQGLAPGAHQLHFGGSSESFSPAANCCTNMVPGFSTDTTANIVVVPEPSSALLILTGIVCLFTLRARGSKLRAGN